MTDPLNHGIKIENQGGITVSIFIPFKTYCEIEDLCQRQGITLDKYFLNLHTNKSGDVYSESTNKGCPIKSEVLEEIKQEVTKKIKKK